MVSDSVSVSSSSQSAESSSPPPILVSYLVALVGGMTVRYPPTDRSGRSVKGGEVSLLSKEDLPRIIIISQKKRFTRIRERYLARTLPQNLNKETKAPLDEGATSMNSDVAPSEIPDGFTLAGPGGTSVGGGDGGGGSSTAADLAAQRDAQRQAILEQAMTPEALARLRRVKVCASVTIMTYLFAPLVIVFS